MEALRPEMALASVATSCEHLGSMTQGTHVEIPWNGRLAIQRGEPRAAFAHQAFEETGDRKGVDRRGTTGRGSPHHTIEVVVPVCLSVDRRFRRKSFIRLIPIAPDRIAFRSPSQLQELTGDDAVAVRAAWDSLASEASAADVAAATGASADDAAGLLDALTGAGFVESDEAPTAASSLFHDVAGNGGTAALASAKVFIDAPGAFREPLAEALREWGIPDPCRSVDDATLVVAIGRSDGPDRLESVAKTCVAAGRPALFAEWRGFTSIVGPFQPGRGAPCWTCADLRRWNNAAAPEVHVAERGSDATASGIPPRAHVSTVTGVLACEVARIILTGESTLRGSQLEADHWNLRFERTPILPVPGCPTCGFGTPTAAARDGV